MADLYSRLEEIQGMTRLLIDDVEQLRPLLGDWSVSAETSKDEEACRRFFVRAVFALIEAVVEQHKRLLLDLAERGVVKDEDDVREALSERRRYLRLREKIRQVYQVAQKAFGRNIAVSYENGGWASFEAAVRVRNRITHPKNFDECFINEADLHVIEQGHAWFRALQNEFVRVAREHRGVRRW